MARAEWIDGVNARGVLEVAGALGLRTKGRTGSGGGQIFGCPACGAETRHTKTGDKRGAVGIRSDGTGWRCHQCDASDTAFGLVPFAVVGRAYGSCSDSQKANVRAWCCDFLGLPSDGRPPAHWKPRPAPAPRIPKPPRHLPSDDLAALWGACSPVTEHSDVCAWMTDERPKNGHARLDPASIARLDAARVAPIEQLPTWAGSVFKSGPREGQWESFPAKGQRLAVPLYDVDGAMRSMIFRRTFETESKWPRKAESPEGYDRKGMAMMCPLARTLFSKQAIPSWWVGDAPTVCIAEGDTDYLAGVAHFEGDAATVGIVAGSWTSRHAYALPKGCTVSIRTDPDEAGAKYAARIVASLWRRVAAGELRLRLRREHRLINDDHGRPVGVELAK